MYDTKYDNFFMETASRLLICKIIKIYCFKNLEKIKEINFCKLLAFETTENFCWYAYKTIKQKKIHVKPKNQIIVSKIVN